MDNGYLGMVRQWQEFFFERRYAETYLEYGNPDFVTVAQGFGLEAWKITRPEEVRPSIEKALGISGPVLIHCIVEKEENVYPMIPSGKTVNDTIG
jgi:acetolactate synthase-1/2/3 large subunit